MSTDCDLRLNVFRCRDGFVLSPDCIRLPIKALEKCGVAPKHLGVLACGQLPEELCTRVRAEISADAFAYLSVGDVLNERISGIIFP